MAKTVFVPCPTRAESQDFTNQQLQIDREGLVDGVQKALDDLEAEGLVIVAVTPITGAHYGRARDGAFGYGYTDGVLITARSAHA